MSVSQSTLAGLRAAAEMGRVGSISVYFIPILVHRRERSPVCSFKQAGSGFSGLCFIYFSFINDALAHMFYLLCRRLNNAARVVCVYQRKIFLPTFTVIRAKTPKQQQLRNYANTCERRIRNCWYVAEEMSTLCDFNTLLTL